MNCAICPCWQTSERESCKMHHHIYCKDAVENRLHFNYMEFCLWGSLRACFYHLTIKNTHASLDQLVWFDNVGPNIGFGLCKECKKVYNKTVVQAKWILSTSCIGLILGSIDIPVLYSLFSFSCVPNSCSFNTWDVSFKVIQKKFFLR